MGNVTFRSNCYKNLFCNSNCQLSVHFAYIHLHFFILEFHRYLPLLATEVATDSNSVNGISLLLWLFAHFEYCLSRDSFDVLLAELTILLIDLFPFSLILVSVMLVDALSTLKPPIELFKF